MLLSEDESASAGVSPIVPLALSVIDGLVRQQPTDLSLLRDAMELLFRYLSSPEGRTEANVAFADSFLMRGIENDDYWSHLPQRFREVLWDAGGQLHDTISAPEVAAEFESTPEQLLDRTRWLGVDPSAS